MTSRTQSLVDFVSQMRARRKLSAAVTTLQEAEERLTERSSWSCGPTGFASFEALWPEAVLSGGRLVEWTAVNGGGARTFAMLSAAQALRARPDGQLVLIESPRSKANSAGSSQMPAAAALGVDPSRVLILKPFTWPDALWAWEQTLRCRGAAACCGWLNEQSPVVLRRLHRAAEIGENVALVVRSERGRSPTEFADVSWRVQSLPPAENRPPSKFCRRFRVELLKCRGRIGGGVADVELSHETTRMPVVSAVA